MGAGHAGRHLGDHQFELGLDVLLGRHPDLDAADVGFVGDVRRVYLHDHWEAYPGSGLGGLLGGGAGDLFRDRHAIRPEYLLALALAHGGAAGRPHGGDGLLHLRLVALHDHRGIVSGAVPHLPVAHHGAQGPYGPVRGIIAGDVGLLDHFDARVGLGASHERSHHRLVHVAGEGGQVASHRGDVHGVQGSQEHRHAGDVGVVHHGLDGELIAVRRGVPQDVHGVVAVGGLGKIALQLVDGLLLERCQSKPVIGTGIGGHDAMASGIGHDGETVALGQRHVGEDLQHVEQLIDGVDP